MRLNTNPDPRLLVEVLALLDDAADGLAETASGGTSLPVPICRAKIVDAARRLRERQSLKPYSPVETP